MEVFVQQQQAIMKVKQIIMAAILGGAAFSISGCTAILLGGGGDEMAGNIRGDLVAMMEEDMETVYNASLKALNELEMDVASKEINGLESKIVAYNSEAKKVEITLKRTEYDYTKLRIRIGILGDKMQSVMIYDWIKKNL